MKLRNIAASLILVGFQATTSFASDTLPTCGVSTFAIDLNPIADSFRLFAYINRHSRRLVMSRILLVYVRMLN